MGILDKIKGWFKKEETEEVILENNQEEISEAPKGEFVCACVMCNEGIYSEDRTKDLNGHTVHKRCFKKAYKEILSGKSFDQVCLEFQEKMKGGRK